MSASDNKNVIHSIDSPDSISVPTRVDSIIDEKPTQDKNVDPAFEFVQGEVIEYDEQEEKRVLSKIDWP